MRDLLLLVPSRGRPANIDRLLTSMQQTCRADTRIVVGVDQDDPQGYQYDLAMWPQAEKVVKPGLHQVVAWINALAEPEVDNYRAFGQVGDDNVFETVGWDVRVMESLERNLFAWGDDKYPTREPGSLCCHVFCRTDVVKRLGYLGPPSISHMLVDVAWLAWAQATSFEYLSELAIPHLHYSIGAAPMDASYQASNSWTANDHRAFNAYTHSPDGLNPDVLKLGGRPYSDEALAQFKRDIFVPCERCG